LYQNTAFFSGLLGEHGPATELPAALETLIGVGDANRDGLFVALEALIALDDLGKAAPLRDRIAALPLENAKADGRIRGYPGRIIVKIVADLGGKPPRPPNARGEP
jgi:hypothetical protein